MQNEIISVNNILLNIALFEYTNIKINFRFTLWSLFLYKYNEYFTFPFI